MELNEVSVNNIIVRLESELLRRADHHPHDDPYYQAMDQAAYEALRYDERFRELVGMSLAARREKFGRFALTSEAGNILERALAQPLVDAKGRQETWIFPELLEAYKDPDRWQQEIHEITHGEGPEQNRFKKTLARRDLLSDRPERELLPALIIDALVGPGADIVDIGTSQMLGPKQHSLNARIQGMVFDPVEIIDENDQLHEANTKKVNGRAAGEFLVGRFVCIDSNDAFDPAIIKWAEVSTILLREREKKDANLTPSNLTILEKFLLLQTIMPHNITFIESNANEVGRRRIATVLPDGADVAMLRTCLYQARPSEQKRILRTVEKLLKDENSFIIVQDFAHLNPENRNELVFDSTWFNEDWKYNTFILHQGRYYHMFSSKNSRCRTIKPGPDIDSFGLREKLGLTT